MTAMKKALLIITALFICLSSNAQSVAFVNINPDPASMAVAGTGVARSADAYAMENNVAAIALNAPKMAVVAGYGLWQPGAINAKLMSAQGFYRIFDRLSVALQYKGFSYPEYSIVSADGRVKGTFAPREMAAGVGVAFGITDNISVGASIRMVNSSLAKDDKGTGMGADVALKYEKDAFQAGLSINNFGSKVKYAEVLYSLPLSARAGAAYSVKGLTLSIEADYILKGGFAAGAGAEYTLFDIVSLRAGYHYGKSTGALTSFASAGIGVHLYGVSLDFAYLTASPALRNTMMFSLGYAF